MWCSYPCCWKCVPSWSGNCLVDYRTKADEASALSTDAKGLCAIVWQLRSRHWQCACCRWVRPAPTANLTLLNYICGRCFAPASSIALVGVVATCYRALLPHCRSIVHSIGRSSRNLLSSTATALQKHGQRRGCSRRTPTMQRASRLASGALRTESSWLAGTTHKPTCYVYRTHGRHGHSGLSLEEAGK
jgi:hypothetical protein